MGLAVARKPDEVHPLRHGVNTDHAINARAAPAWEVLHHEVGEDLCLRYVYQSGLQQIVIFGCNFQKLDTRHEAAIFLICWPGKVENKRLPA